MAVSRKRKHTIAVEQSAGKHTSTFPAQRDMKLFPSVSKNVDTETGSKKRKIQHVRQPTPPAISLVDPTPAKAANKRKRRLESVVEDSDEEPHTAQKLQIFKQFAKKDIVGTPSNKRFKVALPPSPAETPSKSTAALFDKLQLDATSITFAFGRDTQAYDTPPDTPEVEKDVRDLAWPAELQELCQLYAAFLTALSVYYAHSGVSSSADIGTLLPLITKQWRKRAVTVDDLRKLFAIGRSEFALEDRGRAGVCLARAEARGRALKRAASYVDEDDLNGRFEDTLQAKWMKWQAMEEQENGSAATFANQLPLIEVVKSATVEQASPLFARGQQRLADMKAAQAAASQATEKPLATQQQTTQNRGTTLLDRVLARQALSASSPAGPTKAQLERKAALHRIQDIARMLGLLVGNKARVSLGMQAMVQQLQQSLRNPISKDEVERCLVLMEREITPGFVSVIVTGVVKGVVVCRAGQISAEEIKRRVDNAVV